MCKLAVFGSRFCRWKIKCGRVLFTNWKYVVHTFSFPYTNHCAKYSLKELNLQTTESNTENQHISLQLDLIFLQRQQRENIVLLLGFGTIYHLWVQMGNIPTNVLLKEKFQTQWGESWVAGLLAITVTSLHPSIYL